MSKQKRIRRIGPEGSTELSSSSISASPEELLRACLHLGQDVNSAQDTVEMYLEGILDPSDASLMLEVVKEFRENSAPAGMPMKREQPAIVDGKRVVRGEGSSSPAFSNPRNPTHSKQKVTIRDNAGRVIGLKDV